MKAKGTSMRLTQYARGWTHSLPTVAFAIAVLSAGNLSAQEKKAATESTNICLQTAADVLASCKSAAQSDYQATLGKCINITDPAARKSCEKQAASDVADALQTCQGGFQVRQGACQRLGPAAYDPVIDPTNFTTVIDNPFFPLTPGTTYVYEVTDTDITDPFDLSHFGASDQAQLTLMTCYPPGSTAKRYYVFSKLIGQQPIIEQSN